MYNNSKMSPTTGQLAYFLQGVGYRSVVGYPYLTAYLHLLVSALLPIYAGAHASLSRPSSAAKPPKGTKKRDDDLEEQEQTMEGLGPIDAILLPLFAGLVLASLYFLIKWLGDPALLNKILNWYFSGFGVWSLARMLRDGMAVFTSFVFPSICEMDGKIWEISAKHRRSRLLSSPSVERRSLVPKISFAPPLPSKATDALWALRELPSRQLDVRVYIHKLVQARFKIGPRGISSLFFAITAVLYFNLIGKPWWLTNLLGFSFAYSSLQIMSPTTSWTGTRILGALFLYDIYFVFFTPVMVTVATQLDIPAKLVFPRPSRPTEDAKRAFFMLGLGDIILPGMMIGFALRFDLYLSYLRKQTRRRTKDSGSIKDGANDSSSKKVDDAEVVKATWYPATGGWGERFWTPQIELLKSMRFKGTVFPKTYFHASLIGYFLALICTLAIMDIYGRAQPALLYLVPGVLGSLWGTALVKGDIKTLWAFDESEDDQGEHSPPSKSETQDGVWKKEAWMNVDWKSLFLSPNNMNGFGTPEIIVNDNDGSVQLSKGNPKRVKRTRSDKSTLERSKESRSSQSHSSGPETSDHKPQGSKHSRGGRRTRTKAKGSFERDRNTELVFLSINFPKAASATSSSKTASSREQDSSSAHARSA